MALIPIVYLLSQTGTTKFNEKEADLIRRYLLITGLRSVFRGSTETTVNSYVNAVRDTRGDRSRKVRALFDRIPKVRKYRISKNDVQSSSGLYSPLMQVYLAYLIANEAKTWVSGRALADVIKEELTGDPLAVHHIFPKQYMANQDIAVDRLNTCANYAILSQPDNAAIGDQAPFDMWRGMRPNQQENASLQLCFKASEKLLLPGAYEEFVSYRSEKLAEQLNAFLDLG